MDVDDLVAFAVAVEARHGLGRLADLDLDVRVPHEQPASGHRVAARYDGVRVGEAVHVRVGYPLVPRDRDELAGVGDPARGVHVVQDRLVAAEPLVAEDLLDEQGAVTAHLHVPLGGDLSEAGRSA